MQQISIRNKTFNKRNEANYGNLKTNPKTRICLDCNLPAKNCNHEKCERYISEIKKIKGEKND